jgi:hypothetical protein
MVLASSRIRSNAARHAVSRLMEFCSQRELQNQTGHSVYEWRARRAIRIARYYIYGVLLRYAEGDGDRSANDHNKPNDPRDRGLRGQKSLLSSVAQPCQGLQEQRVKIRVRLARGLGWPRALATHRDIRHRRAPHGLLLEPATR